MASPAKPATATACLDPHCPQHGHFPTRGAVKEGTVRSSKIKYLAVIEIPIVRQVTKYERSAKRRSRVHAHVPGCMTVTVGDRVHIAECRRISKTKSFVVTKILSHARQ